jgi:hypothetical protein
MKTEVIMKRKLLGIEVSQKSKSEFLSATDLVKAGNKWRINHDMAQFNLSLWFKKQSTQEFIKSLDKKFGNPVIKGRGRNSCTWVHPFLFIDIALSISPELKIETYEWLYDYLLKYRNNSGDSYKEMCGYLYIAIPNKREFTKFIKNTSSQIKEACGIKEWEDWQKASQDTLELRDNIHKNIILLSDVVKVEEAVRLGIKKALKNKSIKIK